MFSFWKRSTSPSKPLWNTDMHSHLIPGIDDGAKTLEDSVNLILALKAMGYEKIITTPHIYCEYYPNSSEIIKTGLTALTSHLKSQQIDIPIEAAAEYFMDEHFEQLLANKDLLTFGDNYVLVEMSFYFEPPKILDYIFEMRAKGYQPILAHPERYLFYSANFERYATFKEYGCYFQLNLLSLLGYYGKPVQQLANSLLKRGWIDFVGTDTHHDRHIEVLKKGFDTGKIYKELEKYQFLNSLL
jgi:tyrosine-protein phosphatase YwqE